MTLNEFARSLLSRFSGLTAREADILARVAQGWANATIASALGLTERTVKNILTGVPFKVGIPADDRGGSLRVRLTLRAHGIIPQSPPVEAN